MPRTQCQATALEVLCRHTGPPARRWRGAGPCHGPLSHPTALGGPTSPWGRPGAAIEAHAAMHPTPKDAPDPPQGVVGDATPPASPPWDARRYPGTAAWAKGHSAAPKGANGTAWPKFGTSPRTNYFRFQPELRTNWPSLRPLRRAARVAHASRTSREGSRLPWSRHRRDGFVLDASFVPFGTVLS